jgi:NAD(P)-dependent dehydrogenase (short-subunit alcohol dehydrogenase family)
MARTAVIAGVGPGLGASVARRFAREGLDVALLARTESFLDGLAAELDGTAGSGFAVPTDLAETAEIDAAFETVRQELGGVDVLVNHASAAPWRGLADLSIEEFDRAMAVGPRAAVRCSQHAVRDMLGSGDGGGASASDDGPDDAGDAGGTVIFTGATSALRGREGAVAFSAAKFACRGIAESMARELGPGGIHVAHVVVDGGIRPPDREVSDPDQYLDPDAIADTYWHLVEQDRSAWTLEVDLRPHVEEF